MDDARWRRPVLREWLLIAAVLLGLTAVAVRQQWFWRIDRTFYDAALSWWERPAPPDVAIVAIDETSLGAIGRWPWPRATHAALLARLAGARAVGLDLIFTEPDARDPSADAALRAAILAQAHVVLPVLMERQPNGALRESLPIPELASAAAGLGHIQIELDADGIARSVFLREGLGAPRWPHFSLRLLEVARSGAGAIPEGERDPEPVHDARTWVRDRWVHIPFAGGPGHFATVPYVDVLLGRVPAEFFSGKIVLVGATAAGLGDAYPVPSSGHGTAMAGVEISANVLDALRAGLVLKSASAAQAIALALVPLLLALVGLAWLGPRQSLALIAVLALATLAGAWLLLRFGRLWVGPAATLLALTFCYPLWSWRRLESAQRFLDAELDRLGHAVRGGAPAARETHRGTLGAIEGRIDALHEAAARLRDAEAARRAMLDFIAHDLRAPQASILALLEQPHATPADVAAAFERIGLHARAALELADGFMHLARAEAHDPRAFEEIELAAVLHEAADAAWELAGRKGVTIERRIGDDAVWVSGDRSLLQRAIGNLLGNAIKFSPAGTTVVLSLEIAGGSAVCAVTDQGPGIAAADQAGLFERFRRVAMPGQPRADGAGLGLALVRVVALKHGGQARVESAPGRGSRFELVLPVIAEPA